MRLTVATSRKILCVAAFAAGAVLLLVPAGAGAATARRQRLEHADLFQAGRDLVFTVRTAKPVALAQLEPRPDVRRAAARYLCLRVSRAGQEGGRLLCLGG